ncbi:MAG: alpha/beta fold hydrolase [Polyangiales bacterium]
METIDRPKVAHAPSPSVARPETRVPPEPHAPPRPARRKRLLRRETRVLSELTPYVEIFHDDITRVRAYPPLQEATIELDGETIEVEREPFAVPLVLVAPLAVNMGIYDFFPDRSLVRYLLARGFRVYLVDWGRPEPRHDSLHLHDFFADKLPRALEAVRRHAGTRTLSLHGWSFGGLFSLSHTALGDPDVRNLVLVGAPCDYHANGALGKQYRRLSKPARFVKETTGLGIHRTPRSLVRSPGWANSLGFKLLSPTATLQSYLELVRKRDDAEHLELHATHSAFLDDMTAYPGGVVQDIVQFLVVDNCLAKGRLPMPTRRGAISDVKASLFLVAGTEDTIVAPACTERILELVGSRDVTAIRVPGGHLGILGGSKAPGASWRPIADWLSVRSR